MNNPSISVESAMSLYKARDRLEPLDLVILGIGEDGHIASLFPTLNDDDYKKSGDALKTPNAGRNRQMAINACAASKIRPWRFVKRRKKNKPRNIKATDEVMDSDYCVAIQEAGNRMHVQKSLLSTLLKE